MFFGWTFFINLSGLSYNSDNYEKIHNLPQNTYTKEYGAFVLGTLITSGAFVFVFILFVQYCYLIPMNVTMWESTSYLKITYLKPYPTNFNPFH